MEAAIPNAAIKAVAKRLKRYIDVERREEGFDTSGPFKPLGHRYVGKGLGGTFHYNSLQDKHMQHYYQQPYLRKYLTEKSIVQPGMFGGESQLSHKHSKSDRKRSSKYFKKESTRLMETSAKIIIEQSSDGGSFAYMGQSLSNHSTSKPTRSGYTTPQRRRRHSERSSQVHVHDVIVNDTINTKLEQSSTLSSLLFQNEVPEQNNDDVDAPDKSQDSGSLSHHQLQTTPVCEGSFSSENTPSSIASSSSSHQSLDQRQHQHSKSTTMLAVQTGIGVVNVKSRSAPMIQESVGVSTTFFLDASTQTLVHTETQTEQSVLFKMSMRQQKRMARKLKKHKSKPNETNSLMATCSLPSDTSIGSVGTPAKESYSASEILDGSKSGNKLITMIADKESKRVVDGDVTKMKELLMDNPSLMNSLDGQGYTPLHIACTTGKGHVIQVLGSFGTELLTQTPTGYTAMHLAAMHGYVDCLKVLVSMKCDIDCRTSDSQTPLHIAAMSGELECCRWLVENNANLHAEDTGGRTPYDIAKENEHHDVCCYLMDKSKSMSQTDIPLDSAVTLPTLKGHPQSAESGLLGSDTDDCKEKDNPLENEMCEAESTSKSSVLVNTNAAHDSSSSSMIRDFGTVEAHAESAAQVDLEAASNPDSASCSNGSRRDSQQTDSEDFINTKLAECHDQNQVLNCSSEIEDAYSYASHNESKIKSYPSTVSQHSLDTDGTEERFRDGQDLVSTSTMSYDENQFQLMDPITLSD